jgi:hypothetical protein
MAHRRKDEGELLLVVADVGRFLADFGHQNDVVSLVGGDQSGRALRQLAAKDKNEISRHAIRPVVR